MNPTKAEKRKRMIHFHKNNVAHLVELMIIANKVHHVEDRRLYANLLWKEMGWKI